VKINETLANWVKPSTKLSVKSSRFDSQHSSTSSTMSTPAKQRLKKFIFILLSALVTLLTSKTATCKPTLPFSLPPSLQISFPKFPSFQQLIEKRQAEAMKSYR
jgi:hypothetical protein